MNRLFEVIYEDNGLLVINKPAGLVCHPTKGGELSSLIGRVRLYMTSPLSAACGGEGRGEVAVSTLNSQPSTVRRKVAVSTLNSSSRQSEAKADQLSTVVSPHLVNRLDRETSGVTIVAKNAEVAGELGRLWEARAVEKEYLAIVHGNVADDHGLIDKPLGKDERSLVAVKDCVRPDGAPSQTEFRVEHRFSRTLPWDGGPPASDFPPSTLNSAQRRAEAKRRRINNQHSTGLFTLLRIVPHTGRKHQIRIHLASIGHPVVGDKLYGGDEDLYLALVQNRLTDDQRRRLILPHQALHARMVRFAWKAQQIEFCAKPEPWFVEFCGMRALPEVHA